jgi:hypothetical protein
MGRIEMLKSSILGAVTLLSLAGTAMAAPGMYSHNPDGSITFNKATIDITNFIGQCPGRDVSKVETYFLTDKTPIAPSRRVVIRNISKTVANNPYPFADREYDRDGKSEGTIFYPAFNHDQRILAVSEGKNTFDFIISDNNKSKFVSSGVFDVNVTFNRREVERNRVCRWVQRCYPAPYPGPRAAQGDEQSMKLDEDFVAPSQEGTLDQPVTPVPPFPPPPVREICSWEQECYCP